MVNIHHTKNRIYRQQIDNLPPGFVKRWEMGKKVSMRNQGNILKWIFFGQNKSKLVHISYINTEYTHLGSMLMKTHVCMTYLKKEKTSNNIDLNNNLSNTSPPFFVFLTFVLCKHTPIAHLFPHCGFINFP